MRENARLRVASFSNASQIKFNFSVVVCYGHIVGYGFVGLVHSQSLFTMINLFLHVQLRYHGCLRT